MLFGSSCVAERVMELRGRLEEGMVLCHIFQATCRLLSSMFLHKLDHSSSLMAEALT
jgi:hypothetical protein